jgi:predicted phage tail protein
LTLSYVEVWESATNNLSVAVLVGKSASTNFYRPNLANNSQKYYWVRAVDFSENKSPFTTSATATTLLITPNDFNDAVNALFGEAGAYGIEPVSSLASNR